MTGPTERTSRHRILLVGCVLMATLMIATFAAGIVGLATVAVGVFSLTLDDGHCIAPATYTGTGVIDTTPTQLPGTLQITHTPTDDDGLAVRNLYTVTNQATIICNETTNHKKSITIYQTSNTFTGELTSTPPAEGTTFIIDFNPKSFTAEGTTSTLTKEQFDALLTVPQWARLMWVLFALTLLATIALFITWLTMYLRYRQTTNTATNNLTPQTVAPPGWYNDPTNNTPRWWDGTQWH